MNVLILTPDGVGSTVLQRITTLAMYLQKIDVVNCHELTNGLFEKNFKIYKDYSLGYSQTLEDITNLLAKSKSSLVSRLAKYHVDNRKDQDNSQRQFYQYLKKFNDKIFVCRRKNLFEYAMSWSIREKSLVTNIYQRQHREAVRSVASVDTEFFLKKCKEYVDYKNWIEDNFQDFNVVYYEDFALDPDKKIKELLGIDNVFQTAFGEKLSDIFQKEYLISNRKIELIDKKKFLPLLKYKQIMMMLEKKSILPMGTAAPIKNTTLQDKKNIVSNFNECKELFLNFSRKHNWIDVSNINYDFWNGVNIQ
jgi:hypothetical protein